MKLTYMMISKNILKFTYEGKGYGEFYINLFPSKEGSKVGEAELMRKDPEYAVALLEGLSEELDPKCDHDIIDVGDEEHTDVACTVCGMELGKSVPRYSGDSW